MKASGRPKSIGPTTVASGTRSHLGIDAATLEIRAIEVNDNATGDAPMLPCLLGQIPADEMVASVGGGGAYDTKDCHEAIATRGAQAIVPIRKNAKPSKDQRPGATARNALLVATRRLGRTIWKKWSGYHRRSLVETKMRFQAARWTRHGARLRPPNCRTADPCRNPQSVHPVGHACHCGGDDAVIPPEVWGITNTADLCNKAAKNG